jgi:hypothetical protein
MDKTSSNLDSINHETMAGNGQTSYPKTCVSERERDREREEKRG